MVTGFLSSLVFLYLYNQSHFSVLVVILAGVAGFEWLLLCLYVLSYVGFKFFM